MSIIDRIKRITKANVNELLDSAEAPEKMLKQKIRDLEDTIKEAKEAAATFAVSYKKMEKQQEQSKRLKVEWQQKAEKAVQSGDDEMAKKALGEKLASEERVNNMEQSVIKSKMTYDELKSSLCTLQDLLNDAKLKLSELQSRKKAAAAQKAFGTKFDNVTDSSVDCSDFAKMEEDVLQAESEVEIDCDLRGDSGDVEKEIEKKSKELQVDAELEALKNKMKQ